MAAVFYALNMPLSKVLLTDRSGKEMYWNHNSAYYSWIKKTVTNCTNILDVGCGEGSLVRFLDDGNKKITGIDVDGPCIEKAKALSKSDKEEFLCCDFEEYTTEKVFDAIIFVASIHHMDMVKAIEIAKSLLSPGGKLIIVGLSKPSSLLVRYTGSPASITRRREVKMVTFLGVSTTSSAVSSTVSSETSSDSSSSSSRSRYSAMSSI